jgi:hypothetical protein
MTVQKVPNGFCGCGCTPLKQQEIKKTAPNKTEKEAPKKTK